ncbi:GNAT family N-acetyltransferase [Aeromonas veronii]
MNIKIHNEHKDEIFNILVDNLRQFNFDKMGEEHSQPLIVAIHDDNDEVVGGIAGRTIYHQLLIEVLWVHSDKRGQGLGIQLMEIAEREAKNGDVLQLKSIPSHFRLPNFMKKWDLK